MPVTNYKTYNGRIRSETTNGVITGYLTDALGSVTATVNQSQAIENTYRYKPYGALLAKTGTAPDPGFLWAGDTGSRPTGLAQSGQYNQRRHYDAATANWTTVDPTWPRQMAYVYSHGSPAFKTDPGGMSPRVKKPRGKITGTPPWQLYISQYCQRCRQLDPGGEYPCTSKCLEMIGEYLDDYHFRHPRTFDPSPPGPSGDWDDFSNCEMMAKDWDIRMANLTDSTSGWRGYCVGCCDAILGGGSGSPAVSEVYDDCTWGCLRGEFLGQSRDDTLRGILESAKENYKEKGTDEFLEKVCPNDYLQQFANRVGGSVPPIIPPFGRG